MKITPILSKTKRGIKFTFYIDDIKNWWKKLWKKKSK